MNTLACEMAQQALAIEFDTQVPQGVRKRINSYMLISDLHMLATACTWVHTYTRVHK